jgi:hypothetical protein
MRHSGKSILFGNEKMRTALKKLAFDLAYLLFLAKYLKEGGEATSGRSKGGFRTMAKIRR